MRNARIPLLILAALLSPASALAQSDTAAGPDFWAVTGIAAGSALNVRSGPSASASIVSRISGGTIVRNLGCEGEGRTRWCRVEAPDRQAFNGWVFGRYLVESAPPAPSDALVAGTDYNATGDLACVLAGSPAVKSCPFGVIRVPAKALASIFITLPDGEERLIEFRDGVPVQPPGTSMTFEQKDDTTVVSLNDGDEVYSILDIVYLGD